MTKRTIAVITAMTLIAPVGALAMTHSGNMPETIHQSTNQTSPATMENRVHEDRPATITMPATDVEANMAPAVEDNLTPEVDEHSANTTEVEHERSNESEHNRANDK